MTAPQRRRCLLVGLITGLLAMTSSGCGRHKLEVSVPVSNWPGYEYLYLAHKMEIDQRYGLTIKPVQYSDPQSIVHAYLRGDVPIAQLTTVEAVDLCARVPKRCPVIVLILDESRGGDQIAVVNAVPSISALRGRTVAVTLSTLGPYVLSRALQQYRLRLTDVTLRNMPLAQMPSALRKGEVQAAVFFPPFSNYAARDGASRPLFDSRAIPGEVFDVLAVDPGYLQRHGNTITALIQAWSEAQRQARRTPERALALMASREQVSPREFREAEQGLLYFNLPQQVSMLQPAGVLARNLSRVRAVQQALKLMTPGAPLPQVTPRFVEAAQ
jgi:NitT/TauT family transport system substrate-binding protein